MPVVSADDTIYRPVVDDAAAWDASQELYSFRWSARIPRGLSSPKCKKSCTGTQPVISSICLGGKTIFRRDEAIARKVRKYVCDIGRVRSKLFVQRLEASSDNHNVVVALSTQTIQRSHELDYSIFLPLRRCVVIF